MLLVPATPVVVMLGRGCWTTIMRAMLLLLLRVGACRDAEAGVHRRAAGRAAQAGVTCIACMPQTRIKACQQQHGGGTDTFWILQGLQVLLRQCSHAKHVAHVAAAAVPGLWQHGAQQLVHQLAAAQAGHALLSPACSVWLLPPSPVVLQQLLLHRLVWSCCFCCHQLAAHYCVRTVIPAREHW
jgi:hypothetical protein